MSFFAFDLAELEHEADGNNVRKPSKDLRVKVFAGSTRLSKL